jgi:hypothetical protein
VCKLTICPWELSLRDDLPVLAKPLRVRWQF